MEHSKVKLLSLLTLAGVVLGALTGFLIPDVMIGLGVIGQLFVNALKIILLPLIAASIIMGISRLGDLGRVGRTAVNTFSYFIASTVVAVIIGLVLAMVFRPGAGLMSAIDAAQTGLPAITTQSVSQFLLSLLPANITRDIADGQLLGLIVFALFFGAVLSTMSRRNRSVTEFFSTVHEVTVRLVNLLLWAAPVGLLFLVGSVVAQNQAALLDSGDNLLFFVLTLVIGLAIHAAVILPLVLKIYGKESPISFLSGASSALATAFGTASSAATLPMTYRSTVDDNRVDQRAASFVLPLGSTLNMNGTAMFVAIAAMFIAQAAGLNIGIGQILLVGLVALLVSFGTAGIPGAGLIGLMSVLTLFDIDTATLGLAVIVGVDWLADRLRTVVNVWGDAVGAAVISQTREFQRSDRDDHDDRGPRRDSRQRNDRQGRGDRQSRGDGRSRDDRPSRGDRPQRGDRRSRDDRPSRSDRPSRGDRPQRSERPSRDDRPARPEREERVERRQNRDDSRSRGRRRDDSHSSGDAQAKRSSSPFDIASESAPAIDATATPSTPTPPSQPSRSSRPDRSDRSDSSDRRSAPQRRERPQRQPQQQRPEPKPQESNEDKPKTAFRLDSPPPLPVIPSRRPDPEPEPERASQPEPAREEKTTTEKIPQVVTPKAETAPEPVQESRHDKSDREETPRDDSRREEPQRSEARDAGSSSDSTPKPAERFQKDDEPTRDEVETPAGASEDKKSEPAFGRQARRSRVAVTASGEESKEKEAEPNRPQLDKEPSFSDEAPTYGRTKRKRPGR